MTPRSQRRLARVGLFVVRICSSAVMAQLLEMRQMGMTGQCIDIEGLYICRHRGAMGLLSRTLHCLL